MSDKYDEKALETIRTMRMREGWENPDTVNLVAQALRESAADTFEEAAKRAEDQGAHDGCMDCTSTSKLYGQYMSRAAALRKQGGI